MISTIQNFRNKLILSQNYVQDFIYEFYQINQNNINKLVISLYYLNFSMMFPLLVNFNYNICLCLMDIFRNYVIYCRLRTISYGIIFVIPHNNIYQTAMTCGHIQFDIWI